MSSTNDTTDTTATDSEWSLNQTILIVIIAILVTGGIILAVFYSWGNLLRYTNNRFTIRLGQNNPPPPAAPPQYTLSDRWRWGVYGLRMRLDMVWVRTRRLGRNAPIEGGDAGNDGQV
ncbi:hypothetical protein QBC46DRAFT_412621 [Diplogelasinospora grovesii]|uniref:Uncharacterized protein n=1 Tax=Diplogelasinospora grovesii TaxID=303347 RepID=A0AAN6S0U5_9PEZI|nr:hypothetical protein QBC46DRAFT_412621 [Diplogelasinospora grovesii]